MKPGDRVMYRGPEPSELDDHLGVVVQVLKHRSKGQGPGRCYTVEFPSLLEPCDSCGQPVAVRVTFGGDVLHVLDNTLPLVGA